MATVICCILICLFFLFFFLWIGHRISSAQSSALPRRQNDDISWYKCMSTPIVSVIACACVSACGCTLQTCNVVHIFLSVSPREKLVLATLAFQFLSLSVSYFRLRLYLQNPSLTRFIFPSLLALLTIILRIFSIFHSVYIVLFLAS